MFLIKNDYIKIQTKLLQVLFFFMIFCHIKDKPLYITSEFKLTLKEKQFKVMDIFALK